MKIYYLFQYFYKVSVVYRLNLLLRKTIFALLLLFSSATSFAIPSYRVVIIPPPTDPSILSSRPSPYHSVSINDKKQLTGTLDTDYRCDDERECSDYFAYIYHPIDGTHFLEMQEGNDTASTDINELGQIVGQRGRIFSSSRSSFFWDVESGIIDLTPVGEEGYSKPVSISNTGIVVGTDRFKAFEWTEDSGLKIISNQQSRGGLTYFSVTDNGTKLARTKNFTEPREKTYFFSIPGQNDHVIGRSRYRGSNTATIDYSVKIMNRNAVAAGVKDPNNGPFSNFLADSNTGEIVKISSKSSFTPRDINEKQWVLGESGRLFIPGYEDTLSVSSLISESNGVINLIPQSINNHGDIAGYGKIDGVGRVAVMLVNENRETQPIQLIAQYQADFSTPPKSGWQYQWNASTPIGQTKGYSNMQWDRWKYDSDGLPGLPDTSNLAYGHLSSTGGHPGRGASKDVTHDHYVIAGFTVDEAGEYRISNSQISRTSCDFGNGGVVKIYVNENLIDSFSFNQEDENSFDGRIGLVNIGSTIYVAVGPNGNDTCDGFDWDYAIELVGNSFIEVNQSPVLDNPGKQLNKINDEIQLLLNAHDPDGDVLSFEATGLPTGLAINSASGVISGIISPDAASKGYHHVIVSVSDNQGEVQIIRFNWLVNVIAQYSKDYTGYRPTMGWSYQWNPDGPIGQSNDYADLQYSSYYDSDGKRGLPDDSGLAYGNLGYGLDYGYWDSKDGHPGRGTLQGEEHDRYVIAGFTVDTTGEYKVKDSLVNIFSRTCSDSNGGIIKVFVGDKLIDSMIFKAGVEVFFDTTLGIVEAGETIYIALGPNGKDSCDGFEWDFAIELL